MSARCWSSQTARDSRCCSRCGPRCPIASAIGQQLWSSSSISSPCTIWPQHCRVSRQGKHPATCPSKSASSADRAHQLPWQQRLPRLDCVSQTHHDRGSRTSTCPLTRANSPTVTNYSCRNSQDALADPHGEDHLHHMKG